MTSTRRSRDEHLFEAGPKSILALDGGGVRGIVSLAFLERLEGLMREKTGGGPELRLCDCFDLIGGTSTGAIIATGLALGRSAGELIDIFTTLSQRAFRGQRWHGGFLVPKYSGADLLAEIDHQVGDRTLGSEDLQTGLAIVAKRFDTGSPWVFHNNPRSRYFEAPADDPSSVANRSLPLKEILKASAAAPTYYEPEPITIADGVEGVFVDGGVSPFNNPALLLLMMATSRAYGYGWNTGAGELRLASMGTGRTDPSSYAAAAMPMPSGLMAVQALQSVIDDCSWHAQAVLQWLSRSPNPWRIDSEAGDFADDGPANPMLSYQRYDLLLETEWLARELDEPLNQRAVKRLTAMDRPDTVEELLALARKAAAKQVRPEHLDLIGLT